MKAGRGDYISNTDADDTFLYGSFYKYPMEPDKETQAGGQYTFQDKNIPFTAPVPVDNAVGRVFTSTWRVWAFTRYIGPYIRLEFTVREP